MSRYRIRHDGLKFKIQKKYLGFIWSDLGYYYRRTEGKYGCTVVNPLFTCTHYGTVLEAEAAVARMEKDDKKIVVVWRKWRTVTCVKIEPVEPWPDPVEEETEQLETEKIKDARVV